MKQKAIPWLATTAGLALGLGLWHLRPRSPQIASLSRSLSRSARQKARHRLHHVSPGLAELCPDWSCREILTPLPCGRWACNPGLAVHQGQVWCNLRLVNYRLDGLPSPRDLEGVVRTDNLIGRLPDDPGRLVTVRLEEPAQAPPLFDALHRGLEDLRLFSFRGRLWGSCTVLDRHYEERMIMAILSFDDDFLPERLDVQFHFPGPQKNWVPLVHGDRLLLVYSTDPLVLLEYDPETGRCREFSRSTPSLALENQKGGTPALPFRDGWLYLTHEHERVRVHPDKNDSSYLHRFVYLDRSLRVSSVSPSFYLLERGVEFASGICREPGSSRLLVSFGWQDRRAYLGCLGEAQVARLLGLSP